MSSEGRTRPSTALLLGVVLAGFLAVTVTGLLLREHAPGNVGSGFVLGASVALVGAAAIWWRAVRRPGRASTFERAWTQTGDERDDAVLTRALAVLGLVALPLTGVAAVAIGLGAGAPMVLTVLIVVEVAVGATAFVVVARRS